MHYSPFRHSTRTPKGTFAFDLHVLATPPAFDLSQDQTLHLISSYPGRTRFHAPGPGFSRSEIDSGGRTCCWGGPTGSSTNRTRRSFEG